MENLDYKPFWDETIKQIKQNINASEFGMWFARITFKSASENSMTISTPSNFISEQINQKYRDKIKKILDSISGIDFEINFVVEENKEIISENSEIKEQKKEKSIEKEEKKPHPNLNSDYSFENFVISDNNTFPANAAISISKNPGKNYNPFLIYGDVGLGKTHLMEAIGNEIHNTTDLNVIFTTSENLLNEFVESLKETKMPKFKKKYRNADVLLIDDIQFLQNKEGLQTEFFHTFNALYDSKKQMVFTCDRPPSELKNLTERLKSRFERGLNVDIKPPSYEARYAILRKKLEYQTIQIDNEIIDLIAKNISSNVRDLESALMKIIAFTEISNEKVTKEKAISLLKDVFGNKRQKNTTIDKILKVTSDYFNIPISDIRGKKKTQGVVLPRHIVIYLAQEMTEMSTTEIGSEIGGRDHTTVMHGSKKIADRIISEPSLETTINTLKNKIKEITN
ncbi:MAG: chromosomal replication initiator protein DnaA [Treponema sp.]|nr:MAG: chromosomal replication initiator protein DnaA [Treponema sp.]